MLSVLGIITLHGRYLSATEVRQRCMRELRCYAYVKGLDTLAKRRGVLTRALTSQWARSNAGSVISYFARELALRAVVGAFDKP